MNTFTIAQEVARIERLQEIIGENMETLRAARSRHAISGRPVPLEMTLAGSIARLLPLLKGAETIEQFLAIASDADIESLRLVIAESENEGSSLGDHKGALYVLGKRRPIIYHANSSPIITLEADDVLQLAGQETLHLNDGRAVQIRTLLCNQIFVNTNIPALQAELREASEASDFRHWATHHAPYEPSEPLQYLDGEDGPYKGDPRNPQEFDGGEYSYLDPSSRRQLKAYSAADLALLVEPYPNNGREIRIAVVVKWFRSEAPAKEHSAKIRAQIARLLKLNEDAAQNPGILATIQKTALEFKLRVHSTLLPDKDLDFNTSDLDNLLEVFPANSKEPAVLAFWIGCCHEVLQKVKPTDQASEFDTSIVALYKEVHEGLIGLRDLNPRKPELVHLYECIVEGLASLHRQEPEQARIELQRAKVLIELLRDQSSIKYLAYTLASEMGF